MPNPNSESAGWVFWPMVVDFFIFTIKLQNIFVTTNQCYSLSHANIYNIFTHSNLATLTLMSTNKDKEQTTAAAFRVAMVVENFPARSATCNVNRKLSCCITATSGIISVHDINKMDAIQQQLHNDCSRL